MQAVTAQLRMSHVGVLKHLATLEAAELIVSMKEGRERRLYFNFVPIQQIHEMWSDEYGTHFASGLLRLKRRVESGES